MNFDKPFNLIIFTDTTKKICLCSAAFIFMIVLFVISPLSGLFKTSLLMRLLAIVLMVYTIYLNIHQINLLREAALTAENEEIKGQLAINIICSYIFTVFIGLLILFVSKSFLV